MTSKKILIVEDEIIIKILKIKFELSGFQVDTAQDGAEAMVKLNQSQPDIILLDILMPKMNGFEFLEKIKKDERFKDIPVVIFSNLNAPSDIEKSKALGVLEYILKTDVTISELAEAVEKYLKS